MAAFPITIKKVSPGNDLKTEDHLAVEEPLEIQIEYFEEGKTIRKSISITMRTPGNDEELANGFLFTENIIQSLDQIEITKPGLAQNTVVVKTKEGILIDFKKLERHFYTSSSCGVCGKSSIEALNHTKEINLPEGPFFKSDILYQLPKKLRAEQNIFEQTGGLHAAGLFNTNGDLLLLREDVGRHNAVDKLIGAGLQAKINFQECLIVVSGRASFELIQKTMLAEIPILCAVGAPSSLAAQLAEENKLTLVGFLKSNSFNIYTQPHRIQTDSE